MTNVDKSIDEPKIPPNHNKLRGVDPFSFEVAHRRLAWCFRLSVMTNVVLGCSLIITASALLAVFPLKEYRFAFLREEMDSNKVVRIEPISPNVNGYDVLLEAKAREFVENILPIDELTSAQRYSDAFKMASNSFYQKFKKDRLDSGFLAEAANSKLNRSVLVEAVDVRPNPANPSTHLVSLDVLQRDRFGFNEETNEKRLRVFLEMTSQPQNIPQEEMFTNPLGIIVLNMTIKERS